MGCFALLLCCVATAWGHRVRGAVRNPTAITIDWALAATLALALALACALADAIVVAFAVLALAVAFVELALAFALAHALDAVACHLWQIPTLAQNPCATMPMPGPVCVCQCLVQCVEFHIQDVLITVVPNALINASRLNDLIHAWTL